MRRMAMYGLYEMNHDLFHSTSAYAFACMYLNGGFLMFICFCFLH